MSDELKEIYNACNPAIPASDEYYLESSAARGSSNLAQRFLSHLSKTAEPICFLFSGHIGCGKSTELLHLKRELLNAETPQCCFFPVLVDVSEYLDENDVSPTDILLAIVAELADSLRDASIKLETKTEPEENFIIKQLRSVKIFSKSEIKNTEIKNIEVNLGVMKVGIQRLKKDQIARKEVRAAFKDKMSTLLEETNLLFEQARLAIRKSKSGTNQFNHAELVIILDNLEKIKQLEVTEGSKSVTKGLESQRELFLEHATKLRGMSAHFIYTVPLRLIRSSDCPQLVQLYGNEPIVLPMIKIIERGTRNSYQKGIETLRAILQKRLDKIALDEAFESDALDFLLTYSGGHVRNLMLFVKEACTYTDKLPISLKTARRAIQQPVRTYSAAIPENYWEKLARLELSEEQKIPNGDDDYRGMLENLYILEYIDDDEDPFTEPWYAVNPIVRELQKFKAAVNALQKPNE